MEVIKPYEKYKDSGIPWLGLIPEQWQVRKLKYSLKINNGADYKHIQSENGYPVIGSGGQFAFANDFMFDGEVVFLGRKGTIDKPLYFKGKFWAVDTMFYANSKMGNSVKFHFYVSTQIPFKLYSTSTALPSMTQSDLKEHYLAYPSINEQIAIANFLDYKTAKIDRFIFKKKQLIKLLNEQKAGIINDAVTKGLNANAKMKPSGIEWLGDIPEAWEVRKLKYVAEFQSGEMITSETISQDGEFPVFGGGGFRGYTNNYTNDGNHVLIGRQGALCGNVKYAKGKFWASEHSIVIYPKIRIENIYLGEVLKICNLGKLSQTAAQPGIAIGQIKNVSIPIPPLSEQTAIISHIEKETCIITKTIATIEKEIALVQEYRTALIAEAVTGKIDVREYKMPTLEEDKEYAEMEEEMGLVAEEEINLD